jgi:hypothetical protein
LFLFFWRLIHKAYYTIFPFYNNINIIAFERLFKFEQWLLLNFYSPNNFLNFYANFVHDIEFISIYRELRLDELNIYPITVEQQVKDFFENEYRLDYNFYFIYRYYRSLSIFR